MNLGDRFDHLKDRLHLCRVANDVLYTATLTLSSFECTVFIDQRLFFKRFLDYQLQFFNVERLCDKIIGPKLKCFTSCFYRSKGRHQDHAKVRKQLARLTQQFDPVHIRHLHVGNDDVGRFFLNKIYRLATVRGGANNMAVALKNEA